MERKRCDLDIPAPVAGVLAWRLTAFPKRRVL
jgi:hypothetical protein